MSFATTTAETTLETTPSFLLALSFWKHFYSASSAVLCVYHIINHSAAQQGYW